MARYLEDELYWSALVWDVARELTAAMFACFDQTHRI